jgi:hypothetical protein
MPVFLFAMKKEKEERWHILPFVTFIAVTSEHFLSIIFLLVCWGLASALNALLSESDNCVSSICIYINSLLQATATRTQLEFSESGQGNLMPFLNYIVALPLTRFKLLLGSCGNSEKSNLYIFCSK